MFQYMDLRLGLYFNTNLKNKIHFELLPLELRIPLGLGVFGRRWILQSMGISLEVGGL